MDAPQFFRNAPAFITGRTISLTDPNVHTQIRGGPNQKQIAISNPTSGNNIYVRERPGGPIIQAIFPMTTWTIETVSDLYIGPSGSANFDCYVAQTFYS